MNRKNFDPFKITVLFIMLGAMAGALIGGLCVLNNTSEEAFFSVISITMKICIGLIVLIVDLLCIRALLRAVIYRLIDEKGETTIGVIEEVTVIDAPNQPDIDEWMKKVRYSCTVSYEADSKKYKKEFSPTPLTSKRELYPYNIEKKNDIRIKYCKSFPALSIIDIDILNAELKNEQGRSKKYFVMLTVIMTMLYIVSVVSL